MPFPQRENVKAFIDGARALGVPDAENFDTGDLFDGSNMKQVLICLHALGRLVRGLAGAKDPRLAGWDGPHLAGEIGKGIKDQQASGGKVRTLSRRLKGSIPTGGVSPGGGAAAAVVLAPGSMAWLENERGEAYRAAAGSEKALAGAAAAKAGGGSGGGDTTAGPEVKVESVTANRAKQKKKAAPTRRRRPTAVK